MTVRAKDRFEIFKRDGFRCQYCGRIVPEVTLQVDHIVPRIEGGTDDPENLLTSCVECNQGKGRRRLGAKALAAKQDESAKELVERRRQLVAYYALQREIELHLAEQLEEALTYWYGLPLGNWYLQRGTIQSALHDFGLNRLREAMDVTAAKANPAKGSPFMYMCGILRNWRQGKVGGNG